MSLQDLASRSSIAGVAGRTRAARHRAWSRVAAWWRAASPVRLFYPALLVVVALSLYIPRLTEPDKYLFDEILFAYTAGEYTEGNADAYQWDDPCSTGK